jgi:transposase-like protein
MGRKSMWKDDFLFDAYELVRQGGSEKQIARICGISLPTFLQWERKRSLLRLALKRGRDKYRKRMRKGGSELAEYVFNGLSPEMKKVWRKLAKADLANSPKQVLDAILEGKGKTFRQYLFIYAFVTGNFQITSACRRVGISVRQFDKWRKDDPDFVRLFKEVMEAKKDLCESHLLELVKSGSEAATIYSVKTLCKDRGYVEKLNVDVNVGGQVDHNVLGFDRIRKYLSESAQMEILSALRKVKEMEGSGENSLPNTTKFLPSSITDTSFVSETSDFRPNVE